MAVYARRGETEKVLELLNSSVRKGQILIGWSWFLRLAFAPPLESEAFDTFVEAYEAEKQRLAELY